jgi:hypothetical protein
MPLLPGKHKLYEVLDTEGAGRFVVVVASPARSRVKEI